MSKESEINRREFLKSGVKAGAGLAALSGLAAVTHPERVLGANDRVQIAVVGLHGQGFSHVQEYAKTRDVAIAAVCDVDENVLAQRSGRDGEDGPAEAQDLHRLPQAARRQID